MEKIIINYVEDHLTDDVVDSFIRAAIHFIIDEELICSFNKIKDKLGIGNRWDEFVLDKIGDECTHISWEATKEIYYKIIIKIKKIYKISKKKIEY